MNVSDYQFSDEEIVRFHKYRDNQDDARLKVRFIALLMLAEGIEIHKVVDDPRNGLAGIRVAFIVS